METSTSRDRRTTSEMWSGQRSMLILFGVVCGILCGIADLSDVDKKIVRRIGNYDNEVSLLWHSHTHLQRLTGHRDNSTSTKCTFRSSRFVIDIEDVPVIQYIWQIQANKCEHTSNTSTETLIYSVTWTFDYEDDENADVRHEYLYCGSVTVRIRHSPDWNRGNTCVFALIMFFQSFFINYTKDSHKCSHVRWMEVCLFISRGHHVSSTHS